MPGKLQDYVVKMEELGRQHGLEYYPIDFELVPPSFMTEVAVYGLPVRMPHWSFGVRWIYQMVQHKMGHSKIFEVVFPGNPNRAYLVNSNSLEENTLVVAHVLGHADFSHNNLLFVNSQREAGYHIVEQAAAHAHRIDEAIEIAGQRRVEAVLDAALALEQHIDPQQHVNRSDYGACPIHKHCSGHGHGHEPAPRAAVDEFQHRFHELPGEAVSQPKPKGPVEVKLPPHPEADLLWFIARHGPALEDWERDIFLAVREESFYFQPVFSCQIMNEGWASYWHARLLREADFLPDELYLNAMKTHSDVVRPYGTDKQIALAVNPYHLGFQLWERIVRDHGLEAARRVMKEEDDFSFIRNYLTAEIAQELNLFVYEAKRDGEIKVTESNLHELHEAILAPKYNFGAPRVTVEELKSDGTLVLRHDHTTDGRGLDPQRAQRVLEYVHKVWRRPVMLYTVDARGEEECLRA